MRDLRVSINTAIWMVMWRDPEIRVQPVISNICYVYLLSPIVSKVNVHVCTSWQVNVIAKKIGKIEYK